MSNMREASKTTWTSLNSLEHINAGSLQRIADATEKMAASCDALRDERDRYKRWYEEEMAAKALLERRVRSLRGVITKLKRSVSGGTA